MDPILAIVIAVVAAIVAGVIAWFAAIAFRKKVYEAKVGTAENKAREIIDDALKTAETKKREALLEAKEESIKTKNELERESKERRAEIQRYEKRVLSKEEAIGTIATPDNRKARGGYWYAGDTLQAAIGQSDNQFTPVALCNYAAALANGGTLYSAHILKGVCENENKISYTEPKVLNTLDILPKTMQTIREGMLMVTKSGTAKDVFSDFLIDVAGKTGTAQRGGRTNGLFIGYAPADDPEISFCVVVEGGASGNQAARILKEILANYFNTDEKGN